MIIQALRWQYSNRSNQVQMGFADLPILSNFLTLSCLKHAEVAQLVEQRIRNA